MSDRVGRDTAVAMLDCWHAGDITPPWQTGRTSFARNGVDFVGIGNRETSRLCRRRLQNLC